jgi:hypothetical protein
MRIIISLTPDLDVAGHDEALWSKEFELDYLPPIDMYIEVGEDQNRDIVAGNVVRHKLNIQTNTTEVTVAIKFASEADLHSFAMNNGWRSRDSDTTLAMLQRICAEPDGALVALETSRASHAKT